MKLGSLVNEGCASLKCRVGSKPTARQQRVIRVLTSRVVLKCPACGNSSFRKTRRLENKKGKS